MDDANNNHETNNKTNKTNIVHV